ncbi:unnamed protein product [Schistocephalus solidus]|uniref:Gag-pol polyprotein n=1 Tax=Schistocephalus solidus TaxID=70667 RepID=A0A183S8W5_SCHSO|nr:unnamed protein product [Schistocephalus solidus]
MERVSNAGNRPPKPDNLTVYDGYDLWEDRMKVYLEAADEDARPAAIQGRLDNEIHMVARADQLTASLTPATIFERLRREFARSDQAPIPPRSPSSITVALDIARREEAIHTACPFAQETLPSMSSPWDGDRAATSAHRQLNGSGTLLNPLLLGVVLHNPQLLGVALHSRPLLGEALHSLLDAGTGGNNVVVRPTLHLPQVFM